MPTHTFDLNGKMPEGLPKKSSIYGRGEHFFKDFDTGAQGVAEETAKLPKDGPGTPNGRPRVQKYLQSVWKLNPKVTKSSTISFKRHCNDTSLSHKHNFNTKT